MSELSDHSITADSPDPVTPLSILALDDDEDFLQYLREVLTGEGHEVRTMSSPDEFYREVEARLPDVVLLDIKMAGTLAKRSSRRSDVAGTNCASSW